MALSIDDLRAFVMAVDLGSVSRAATALGVTQSALSKRLKSLEGISGQPLLHRSPGGVEITPAGKAVLADARRTIAQVDALEARLATLSVTAEPVRIASSPAIADRVVPVAIGLLDVGDDAVPIELLVANSNVVRQAIAGGRADIGIPAADWGEDLSRLGQPLLDDELVVVLPPGDPWEQQETISADQLVSRRLVLRDPASHVRRTLDHALAQRSLDLAAPVVELGNPAAVKAAIRARGVPGVLSMHAVDPVTDGLSVRPIDGIDVRRRYWVLLSPTAGPDARRVAERLLGAVGREFSA